MPVNLSLVWKVAGCVSVPVIGCGGIACADDALEFLSAGATAVQVGTAIFADPHVSSRIARGLAEHLKRRGLSRIAECIGMAREEKNTCALKAVMD
jgi:dihydroorotate dehydrogenase (NAD+) catalytic subunit